MVKYHFPPFQGTYNNAPRGVQEVGVQGHLKLSQGQPEVVVLFQVVHHNHPPPVMKMLRSDFIILIVFLIQKRKEEKICTFM